MANAVLPVHVETVLVENSDDRLASVEEAKRTGEPFKSVAANKTEVVPYAVAFAIADEKANDNTYVGPRGRTYAAHLESYHEKIQDNEFVVQTNEEKARAHEEYSAELVRKQMADEARVQKMKAEGYDPTVAVQQANLERAREHEQVSAEYLGVRRERADDSKTVLQVVDETVNLLRSEDLIGASIEERLSAMQGITNVPDAMEQSATNALVTKDKIIETVLDYKDETASHESLVEKDRPGIAIMDAAGSPEELADGTAVAQLYADNMTADAAEAATEMQEVAADSEEESPAKVQQESEAAVNPFTVSDEMRDNPEE